MRVTFLTKRRDNPEWNPTRWGRTLAVGIALTAAVMAAPAGLAQETTGIGASGRVDVETAADTSPADSLTGIGASGIVSPGPATLPAAGTRDAVATTMQAMPSTGVGPAASTSALAAALAALGAVGAGAVALRQAQPRSAPLR